MLHKLCSNEETPSHPFSVVACQAQCNLHCKVSFLPDQTLSHLFKLTGCQRQCDFAGLHHDQSFLLSQTQQHIDTAPMWDIPTTIMWTYRREKEFHSSIQVSISQQDVAQLHSLSKTPACQPNHHTGHDHEKSSRA